MASEPSLPPDFVDLLTEFAAADVRYLVIGGYAVGFHDRPRATKDLDLLIADTHENIDRACRALAAFGAPAAIVENLRIATHDEVVWFGVAPARVDLLKSAGGVDFDAAYARRAQMKAGSLEIAVVGIEDLLTMKRAADRDQDRADVARLERILARRKPAK
jgi:predicted nucleotidyltransferase